VLSLVATTRKIHKGKMLRALPFELAIGATLSGSIASPERCLGVISLITESMSWKVLI
jgi:hypothetical protein